VVDDERGDGVGVEEGGCAVRSEDGGKVEVARDRRRNRRRGQCNG